MSEWLRAAGADRCSRSTAFHAPATEAAAQHGDGCLAQPSRALVAGKPRVGAGKGISGGWKGSCQGKLLARTRLPWCTVAHLRE